MVARPLRQVAPGARSKRRERERRRAPRLGHSRRAKRANTGRDRDMQQESGGRGAPGNDEPTRGGVCVKRPRRRPRRSERTVCVAGRYCRVTRVRRHDTSSRRHRAHRTSHGCRSGRRRRAGSLSRQAASEPRDAASLARKTTRSSRCWCVHWFFLAVHLLMSLKPTSYLHSLSLSGTPTGKSQVTFKSMGPNGKRHLHPAPESPFRPTASPSRRHH